VRHAPRGGAAAPEVGRLRARRHPLLPGRAAPRERHQDRELGAGGAASGDAAAARLPGMVARQLLSARCSSPRPPPAGATARPPTTTASGGRPSGPTSESPTGTRTVTHSAIPS
jgi:hypothetical protein